jgi:hypothetical protein
VTEGRRKMTGKNKIMIFGPKDDGSYVVEFKTADGEVLSISIPETKPQSSGTSRSGCRTVCSCRTMSSVTCLGRSVTDHRHDAEAKAALST